MADDIVFSLKMAQVDWKEDPIKYVTSPQRPSKSKSVTPTLTLHPTVEEALKRLDAIGFNMASQGDAMQIAKYLADSNILGAISDMTQEEYAQVYSRFIKSGSAGFLAKLSMRQIAQQNDDMVELLHLLLDAGLRMDEYDSAVMVLSELSEAKTPAAPLANQLLQVMQDENLYNEMVAQAAEGAAYQNPPDVPIPSNMPVQPGQPPQPPYKTVMEKEKQVQPGQDAKTMEQMIKEIDQDILEAEDAESKNDLMRYQKQLRDNLSKKQPQSPEVVYQSQPLGMELAQQPQVAPTAPQASISPVAPGESTGVAIYPESSVAKSLGYIAKGGDTVVSYTRRGGPSGRTPQKAKVIGKTSDGKLAVRLVPSGTEDIWDAKADKIHKSM